MPPKTTSKGTKNASPGDQKTETRRRMEDHTGSQILAGVEDFSGMFSMEGNKQDSGPQFPEEDAVYYRSKTYENFNILRQDDALCDVTLLAGPQKTPFRAHRLVLASTFEYFKVMFTSELQESKQDEIHVPGISAEDMTLLLDFAYKTITPITSENVHKLTILANYFGSEYLIDRCRQFMMGLKNEENYIKMVEYADRFDIVKLMVSLFVEDSRGMDGLWAGIVNLPIGLVLEVIRHPALVIYENPAQNEQTLFLIVMARLSSENNASDHILKLLESIHLPQTSASFLETTGMQFWHIPGVKDLIDKAKKKIDPAEKRQWYLPRYQKHAPVVVRDQEKPIIVNGQETKVYSPCALIKGFPFFLHAFTQNGNERVGIESPVQIEHLGLPFQLKVKAEGASGKATNIYYTGKAEKGSVCCSSWSWNDFHYGNYELQVQKQM